MDCCGGDDEARMDLHDYDVIEHRQCCDAMLLQLLHRHLGGTMMIDGGCGSISANLDYPHSHQHHCCSYLLIH